MSFPNWLLSLISIGIAAIAALTHIALWQRKEYRLDRVRAYLAEPEGALTQHTWLLAGIAGIGLGWLAYIIQQVPLANFFGILSLACIIAHYTQRIRLTGIDRPKWTAKAGVITAVAIFLSLVYATSTLTPIEAVPLQAATSIFFMPVIVALSTGIANIPFSYWKRRIINRARLHRPKYQQVTVIGITGSYGKTSTKYFLRQILSKWQKNVIATKGHRNSEIGVAIDILEQLRTRTKYYIVEMGAYRRGEIKAIADIVRPHLGIITSVGSQHLSLFGSRQAIADTKWELAQSLPADGTLIINNDSKILRDRARAAEQKIITYGQNRESDVTAGKTAIMPESINTTITIQGQKQSVVIPLCSDGLFSSLLAAIAGAHALGMPAKDIFALLGQLKPYPRTMELVHTTSGALVIDDSYSGGDAAAQNALQHLALFPHADKRIVFVPIIELGAQANQIHQGIGTLLAKSVSSVYIWGEAYRDAIQQGAAAHAGPRSTLTWIKDPLRLTEALTQSLGPDTVILLEGRVPKILRKGLSLTKRDI